MKIEENLVKEILNTKTELQFIQVVFRERIPKSVWYENLEIRNHYEELKKMNSGMTLHTDVHIEVRKKNQ